MPDDAERSDASSSGTAEPRTRVRLTSLPTATVPRPRPKQAPPLPRQIGRFVPLSLLGRGGMGAVYRAIDPELDRTVALKLLTVSRRDPNAQRRMRREAQGLAQLSHPNIVQVFDCGIVDGQVYIAMELVAGQSLRTWLRESGPDLRRRLDAFVQAGTGLAAAHAAGLVHRDFKPDNAMIGDDGRVRVLDFGLVMAAPTTGVVDPTDVEEPETLLEPGLTATGAVMGTPAYMAAELHLGRPATAASDQFAFCVALYEALYGERPFHGATLPDLVLQVMRGEPRPPPRGARVPAWLHAIVLRGLRPDPDQRWPSMEAVLEALREGSRRHARRPLVPAVGVAVLASLGAVALGTARDEVPACDPDDAAGASLWSEPQQQRVRAGLLATEAPYADDTWPRVDAGLRDYAARWQQAQRTVCEAPADPRTLDLRRACLVRRRQALDALVEVLAAADDRVLAQAGSSVASLGDPMACATTDEPLTRPPPPRDPRLLADVEALRERLASIEAQQNAGHYAEAAERAAVALREAEALAFAPVLAEAALVDGMAQYKAGDHPRSRASLERAYFVAAELDHREVTRQAASWLVFVVSLGGGEPEAAERWAAFAHATMEGRGGTAEAMHLARLGTVRREQGRREEARDLFEQALLLLDRRDTPPDVRTASTLGQLGMVLSELDEDDEALALHERAVALTSETLGPRHPKLAAALNYRAVTLSNLGRSEEAAADYRQAVEIWRTVLGPEHPDVGVALANLGVLMHRLGRHEEAREHFERVLASWKTTIAADHPRQADLWFDLGLVHEDRYDYGAAAQAYAQAWRIRERALGSEHPATIEARRHLDEIGDIPLR